MILQSYRMVTIVVIVLCACVFLQAQQTQVTIDDRGHLGVGTENTIYRLNVVNGDSSQFSQGVNIYNDYNSASTKYGLYNFVTSNGTGPKYGQYNFVVANQAQNPANYGVWTRVNPNFGPGSAYGLYSKVDDNGSGTHYGLYVDSRGEQNWAAYLRGNTYAEDRVMIGANDINFGLLGVENNTDQNTGVYFSNNYAGSSQKNGISNFVGSQGTGSQFGMINNVTANSEGTKNAYGFSTNISGGANGKDLYGLYVSFITLFGQTLGTKYGVYVNAPGEDNWAGHFVGRGYFSEAVSIGTTGNASGYLLSVNGKIMGEELRIEDSGSWPDYVFSEDYELLSLDALSSSIAQTGHLPGIPDAKTVADEGIHVGEMQKRQMEKIEELTLYILQLHERIAALEEKVCEH